MHGRALSRCAVTVAMTAACTLLTFAPAPAVPLTLNPVQSSVGHRDSEVDPPEISPITATFVQADFATYYRVEVTPSDTQPKVQVGWEFSPPKNDPKCIKFKVSASDPNRAFWKHGQNDGCLHGHVESPRGHEGTIEVVVYDGTFECRAEYVGTATGTGPEPTCWNEQVKLAAENLSSAIFSERRAMKELRTGKDASEAIRNAMGQLRTARRQAAAGGAPRGVVLRMDHALELDAAALNEPAAKALKTLAAAIRLKDEAQRLLGVDLDDG